MAAYVDFPNAGLVSTPAGVGFTVTDLECIFYAKFDDLASFPPVVSGATDQPDKGQSWQVWGGTGGPDDYIYLDWYQGPPLTITGPDATSDANLVVPGWRWYRVTLDVDDGAGNHVTRFYYSDEPVGTAPGSITWNLYTTATVAGITNIRAIGVGTHEVWLGRQISGPYQLDGQIAYLEARDGPGGTLIYNPDFRSDVQRDSATQLTDDTGKVWTVESPAVWLFFETGTVTATQASQVGAFTGTVTPPANTATFAAAQASNVMVMAGTVTNPVTPVVPGANRMGGTGAIRKPPR